MAFLIKYPDNIKIYFYTKFRPLVLIKILNKYCIIKKVFNFRDIQIQKLLNNKLELKPSLNVSFLDNLYLKKLHIKLQLFILVIKQLIFNSFKPIKERLILDGIGFKV